MRTNNKDGTSSEDYALKLCDLGVEQLMNGQIDQAMDTFNESLRIHPTADGFTYRGWARSYLGNFDAAIGDCRRAIRVDPHFGNPYNDIGVYLMQLGRLDEAIQWLERAKTAKRYTPRHFPFLNMGHIYMTLGDQDRALAEYIKALELDPGNMIAKKSIAEMDFDFGL